MNRQSIKARLLAASLFSLSAVGTIALFSCVPLIARTLSSQPLMPAEAQVLQQPIKLSRAAKAHWVDRDNE